MPSQEELVMLQSLPLEIKEMKSMARIDEWINHYGEDNVCFAFSGGKDSTVLKHLIRKRHPNIKGVFSDTGLEYPEIREFVKTVDNIDWVKPKQTFREITIEHGYPLFSKEVAETIRYARKIRVGGTTYHFRERLLGKTRYVKELHFKANELPQKETTRGF